MTTRPRAPVSPSPPRLSFAFQPLTDIQVFFRKECSPLLVPIATHYDEETSLRIAQEQEKQWRRLLES